MEFSYRSRVQLVRLHFGYFLHIVVSNHKNVFVIGNDNVYKLPKMELCFQLDTTFVQKFHKKKLKFNWARLQSNKGESIVIGYTHTFELKVPISLIQKSVHFQMNYHQLPSLSTLITFIST